jgi:hypothetical protein
VSDGAAAADRRARRPRVGTPPPPRGGRPRRLPLIRNE